MIKENLNYIKKLLKKREIFNLYIYFLFSILVSILEIISLGIIPALFSILIDPTILINKFEFNEYILKKITILIELPNLLFLLCLGTIIFFFLKSIIIFLFQIFDSKLFNALKVNLSAKMFKIYLNKDYLFHSINDPIILGRNITSEVNISISHIKSFITITKESLQLLLIFLLLLFANYKITLIIFGVFLLISFLYLKIFKKRMKQKSEIAFFERGFKSKIINQILNAIIEVKLYEKENFILDKFIKSTKNENRSYMFLEIINKIPRIFFELLVVTIVCLALLTALNLGFQIEAVAAIIGLYFLAAIRAYPSINNILIQNIALINGKVSINKLCNELNKSNLSENNEKKSNQNFDFNNSIEFKNISFNYPNRKNILTNLNLKIQKNKVIGIKGDTGSGKSTVIKLAMNLLEPTSGVIEVDGHPMNTIQNSWRKKISYIPQNFYVLNESIMENIFFSEDESEHDLKKISRALKFSKLDKFVDSLPEKLDTIVGPSGKVLSGGQAQRLSIARALYQDREILIFDEATNALDQDTESQILQNICQLKNTKTIIIISHNKDVMEKCDHVLEIK